MYFGIVIAMKQLQIIALLCLCGVFFSCSSTEELSLAELEQRNAAGLEEILARTVSRPWRGEDFEPGRMAGIWLDSMIRDPKSFNHLVAERDAETNAIVRSMTDYLLEYDVVRREWKPRAASPQIIVNEENQTLDIIYTLRDDLYW